MMKGAVRSLRYWMVAGVWFGLMSPAWAATLEDVKLRQDGYRLAVILLFPHPLATPVHHLFSLSHLLSLTFSQVATIMLRHPIPVISPMLLSFHISPSSHGPKLFFDLLLQEPFDLRSLS